MGGYTPQAPSTFDLVKQFDAMRSGSGQAPMASSAYAPAQAAQGGDGHNHGGDPSVAYSGGARSNFTPSGRLVNYGGYQFDEGFAPLVQDVASKFKGLRVASGYRDPQRNAAANGVKNSLHLSGNAVDFSGNAEDMRAAAGYAQSQGYRVLIHNAGSGMHLHVSR